MDREKFLYLFLNANSLLDIAMQEAFSDLMIENGAMPEFSEEELNRAKAELSSTRLEDLNLDALAGLGGLTSADMDVGTLEGLDLDALSGLGTPAATSAGVDGNELLTQGLDVFNIDQNNVQNNSQNNADNIAGHATDNILYNNAEHDTFAGAAYETSSPPIHSGVNEDSGTYIDHDDYIQTVYQEESLRRQSINIYPGADTGYLNDLLAKLPRDMPALTDRISGSDIKRWLAVYKQRNETLTELFQYVRGLALKSQTPNG
jgi:hypothetical protein